MAIECARRIDYLDSLCHELGLEVKQAGNKLRKDDYVRALRNHFLLERYGSIDNIPWSMKFMLSIECLQLCRRIQTLKESDQQKVWESDDWIAEEKLDGCFEYNTPILLDDGTTMPIGEIVEKRLSVNVLSLNTITGKIESKPVVNWFNNGNKKSSEWCCLRKRGGTHALGFSNIQSNFITKNHKVWDGTNWTSAIDCKNAYCVMNWLNDIQIQVLHGMLLGDSCITKDKRCKESYMVNWFHSHKQKDYFDKKLSTFGKFTKKVISYTSGYGSLCYRSGTNNPYIKYVRNLVGDRKNDISQEFLSSLTPLSLAIWYMDDGSRSKSSEELETTNKYSRVNIAAFRYSEAVVDKLVNRLNEFNYCATKRFMKRDNGYVICLNTEGSQRFFADIAKYIPSSMSYKLPANLRSQCDTFDWWNMNKCEYRQYEVDAYTNVASMNSHGSKCAYDIEVADNHNYIANGFIVHNCRMALLWDADEKQFHFFSRNNSMVDYLPQDYKDTIYITSNNFDYDKNFVLDTEVISTSPNIETNDTQCLTQLQSTSALLALNQDDSIAIQRNDPLKFIVFDCLYHDESYMDKPWVERHKQAELLCNILKEHNFNCELNPVIENTEYNKNKKREFFDELIDNQKEGIVLKNKYAKYHATSSRTIDCVKVKRSTSDSLTNDIDAFITDYVVGNDDTRNENMVVGFIFSVRLEKEDGNIVNHKIAVCSNISDYIKEDATVIDDNGNVSLNNDYYFRVATLKGQNISARNMRLTHAVIEMWRPERSADTCEVLKESELKKLIF